LTSGGGLGGYSGPPGWKRRLLEQEKKLLPGGRVTRPAPPGPR